MSGPWWAFAVAAVGIALVMLMFVKGWRDLNHICPMCGRDHRYDQ